MARKASGLLSGFQPRAETGERKARKGEGGQGRTFDETATTLAQASVLPLLGFVDAGHEYVCVLKTSSGDDLGLPGEIPCSCDRIPYSAEIIPCFVE